MSIPTLFDETGRGAWPGKRAEVTSLGLNKTNLIGHLEHHAPGTDGSFRISVAKGDTVFLDIDVYNSIPKDHRPPLNLTGEPTVWKYMIDFGLTGTTQAYGYTILPILFTDSKTQQRFRIKVFCIVVQNLGAGLRIGHDCGWWAGSSWKNDLSIPPTFTFYFGEAVGRVEVQGKWLGTN